MNTGLPRHFTVTAAPTAIGAMSTSMLDSASTSADGFIWSISGQAMAPAPTASVDQVTRSRKSRRVTPSDGLAESDIGAETTTAGGGGLLPGANLFGVIRANKRPLVA